MIDRVLSRRTFIRNTSVAVAGGAVLTLGELSAQDAAAASNVKSYLPKRDGGCAVSFGFDVDMPAGGNAYLYDRMMPWQSKGDVDAHSHLNQDIRDYIEKLVTIAEQYDAKQHFFIQGNTFEKDVDVEFWKAIAARGHAIDSHMYNHDGMLGLPTDEITSQARKTKNLIETHLQTENIGLRGPGGYRKGLDGRPDVQKAILDAGLKWVSTRFDFTPGLTDSEWAAKVAHEGPYYYATGLLEITVCGHIDRSYFDSDMHGDPTKPVADWIAYLKQCVDIAYENHLFLALATHPSTSFKHDREAQYITEIFAYCRKKPDIRLCTHQDIYRWIQA
ncbi:MAG: polysaccharide deacetylase family protein [Aeoliella sp.]